MAKKNTTFGKFLAFTTAVAAIGGACYIFRDRIKETTIYKKSANKFKDLFDKTSNEFEEEDDFFFDDEFEDDVFSDSEKTNREYTSITINPTMDSATENKDSDMNTTTDINKKNNDNSADSSIPTSSTTNNATSLDADKESTFKAATAYENEGLSDTDEEPGVLEEQDKLDF